MQLNELTERIKGLDGRLLEDELFRFAWAEVEASQFDEAARARAVSEGGSSDDIRAAYLRHRVRILKDHLEASKRQQKKAKKHRQEQPRTPEYENESNSVVPKANKEKDVQKTEDDTPFWKSLLYLIFALFVSLVFAILAVGISLS